MQEPTIVYLLSCASQPAATAATPAASAVGAAPAPARGRRRRRPARRQRTLSAHTAVPRSYSAHCNLIITKVLHLVFFPKIPECT